MDSIGVPICHQPQYISFSRPLTDTPEWSLWVPSTWQNVKDLAAFTLYDCDCYIFQY